LGNNKKLSIKTLLSKYKISTLNIVDKACHREKKCNSRKGCGNWKLLIEIVREKKLEFLRTYLHA
jgi:transposase